MSPPKGVYINESDFQFKIQTVLETLQYNISYYYF